MDGYRSYPPVRSFVDQLIRDKTVIYLSQLVRPELLQALVGIANTPGVLPQGVRRAHKLHRWGDLEHVREQWLQQGLHDFEVLRGDFTAVYEVGVDPELSDASALLMARYNLKSYDALHVASSVVVGVADLATLDTDFMRVAGREPLRVYLIGTVPTQ